MSEVCQRCGEDGEDRRTLWMACFYQMNELGLPLKEAKPHDAEWGDHRFYTLRVCKRCRADWMAAIRRWFEETPTPEGDGDIPIRELGALRRIDEAEYQRRHPGREPIHLPKGGGA